jgi:hypothetical protein
MSNNASLDAAVVASGLRHRYQSRSVLSPTGSLILTGESPSLLKDETALRFASTASRVGPIDEKAMIVPFLISTPSQDRQGDVVIPEGCLPTIAWYEANPMVFFAHDSMSPPIALSYNHLGGPGIWIDREGVWSLARFHGKTQLSDEVFRLCVEGILKAASIGFKPRKAEVIPGTFDSEEAENEGKIDFNFGGLLFTEWDLYEYSVVPVPANPEAVRHSLDRYVKSTSLRRHLDPFAARVNKSQVSLAMSSNSDLVAPPQQASPTQVPKPQAVADTAHPRGQVPQCLYFDIALFPDEKSCRSWAEHAGIAVTTYAALTLGELTGNNSSELVFHVLECFPVTNCESQSLALENLEQGVKAVFCVRQGTDPTPVVSSTLSSDKSLTMSEPVLPQTPETALPIVEEKTVVVEVPSTPVPTVTPEPVVEELKGSDGMDEGSNPKGGERPIYPTGKAEGEEESKKEEAKMPYGAVVLRDILQELKEVCGLVAECMPHVEQPKVNKFLGKVGKVMSKLCGKAGDLANTVYPDLFKEETSEKYDDEDWNLSEERNALAAVVKTADEELSLGVKTLLAGLVSDTRFTHLEKTLLQSYVDKLSKDVGIVSIPTPAPVATPVEVPTPTPTPTPAPSVPTPTPEVKSAEELALEAEINELSERLFRLTGLKL